MMADSAVRREQRRKSRYS